MNDYFKVKLVMDKMSLEAEGSTFKQFREISRLLEQIIVDVGDEFALEEDSPSYDFINNKSVQKQFRELTQIYPQYRCNRVVVKGKSVIELEKGEMSIVLPKDELQQKVKTLFHEVDKSKIAQALIFIRGNVDENELGTIKEHVEQELPEAELKFTTSKKSVRGYVVLEGLFFGEFPRYDE